MDGVAIALLILAIALVTGVTAGLAIRRERDAPRGLAPGRGEHIIDVQYSSGLGGESCQIRVPRDPQAYANRFVPRHAAHKQDS